MHQPSEAHEISEMAAMRGMKKLDLECFCVLCTEIHLGTFDRIIQASFETWVILFALRGIWQRMERQTRQK